MSEKPGLLDYARRWPLRLWMGLVFIFLYAPLVVLVVMSFNDSRRTTKWQGFTFDWYVKVFEDSELVQSLVNSLTIAALSTVLSLILGTLAAIALWRFRFPGKPLVDGAFSLPIVVPEICMGVAMLIFFARVMPWPPGLPWRYMLACPSLRGPILSARAERVGRKARQREGL